MSHSTNPLPASRYPDIAAFPLPFQGDHGAQVLHREGQFPGAASHHGASQKPDSFGPDTIPRSFHTHCHDAAPDPRARCCSPSPVGSSHTMSSSSHNLSSLSSKSSQSSLRTDISMYGTGMPSSGKCSPAGPLPNRLGAQSPLAGSRSMSPGPFNLRALGGQSPFRSVPSKPPSTPSPSQPGRPMSPRVGVIKGAQSPFAGLRGHTAGTKGITGRGRGIAVTNLDQLESQQHLLQQAHEATRPVSPVPWPSYEGKENPRSPEQSAWPYEQFQKAESRGAEVNAIRPCSPVQRPSYQACVQVPHSIDEVCNSGGAPLVPAAPGQPQNDPQRFHAAPRSEHSGLSPESPGREDESMTGVSDLDQPSPLSNDSETVTLGRALRVLRMVLDQEFDIRLGGSEPPEDLLDTASVWLEKISDYLNQHTRDGNLVPFNSCTLNGGSDTHAVSSASSRNQNNGGAGQKRGTPDSQEDDQLDGRGEGHDDDPWGGPVSTQLRPNQKRIKASEEYPCPFRKRNPLRFHIREWEYCCKAPFRGMPELKKHILKFHRQQQWVHRCGRCKETFATAEERTQHIEQEQACEVRRREITPPTDIVGEHLEGKLRNRAEHYNWYRLWHELFPNDSKEDIPPPEFEPPVELHEVVQEYDTILPHLQKSIEDALTMSTGEGGALLVPASPNPTSTSNAVKATVDDIMQGVFSRSRRNASGPTTPLRRPPQPQPSEMQRAQSLWVGMLTPMSTNDNHTSSSRGSPRPLSSLSTSTSSAPRAILPSSLRSNGASTPGSSGTSSPGPSAWHPSSYNHSSVRRPRPNHGVGTSNPLGPVDMGSAMLGHLSKIGVATISSSASQGYQVTPISARNTANAAIPSMDPTRGSPLNPLSQHLSSQAASRSELLSAQVSQAPQTNNHHDRSTHGEDIAYNGATAWPLTSDLSWSDPGSSNLSSSSPDILSPLSQVPLTPAGQQALLEHVMRRSHQDHPNWIPAGSGGYNPQTFGAAGGQSSHATPGPDSQGTDPGVPGPGFDSRLGPGAGNGRFGGPTS